jgi:hypothetical protein
MWTAPWQKAGLLIAFPATLFFIGFFERGELKRVSALFRRGGSQQRTKIEEQSSTVQDEF